MPVVTWADYGLPGWADERTLLISVSFSGDTEETIDATKTAIERKMSLIAITSGGKLEELAGIHDFPLLKIDYQSQPRAAIGYLYGSLLTLLTKLQLIDLTEKAYFQAVTELQDANKSKILLPKAEELTVTISNKVPIILAYAPLASMARRYQTQLNENSKTLALAAPIPEACHNLIVGTEFTIPEKI